MTLRECLYYAVREDRNCYYNPEWLEPDDHILPALDMLAALPGPDGLVPVEIEAFCRAMQRRGRIADLTRIPWLHLEEST